MLQLSFSHFQLGRKFSKFRRLDLARATRRYLASVLLASLLTLSVPAPVLAAALKTGVTRFADLASRANKTFATSVRSHKPQDRGQSRGMPPAPVNQPGVKPQDPPSRFDREAQAAALRLNTSDKVVLESGQPMLFAAIPVDSGGTAIHGLQAEWESSDNEVVFVTKNGQAVAGKIGTATLTAKAGPVSQNVQVTVIEGSGEPFGKTKEDSHRPPRQSGRNSLPSFAAEVSGKSALKRQHAFAVGRSVKAGLSGSRAAIPSMLPLRDPNVDPLPDNQTASLYQPANNVGSPPGKTRPGGTAPAVATEGTETGNKNFTFGLPIVHLPGRGIDVSLDLTYNSLLYNKSTDPFNSSTWLTYDVDSGWPAPGFRIGYGQIESQGSFGFTLTDADGTRHALTYTSANNYDTTDGSFIHFTGGSGSGTVFYTDGTRITYGAAGGGFRSYPTQITDHNGNNILISYVLGVGPRISAIQDTLARSVTFNYAANGDLTSITAPGLTLQPDREVMRFFYDDLDLSTSGLFTGVNVTKPASAHVIKYVFLANSVEANSAHLGYRFDYSAYGMIYQSVEFRGMVLNAGSAAVANEGTQAAVTTYNYPGTPINSTTGLSDAPTYTTRTDDWAGRTTSVAGNPPAYTFSVIESTGVSTVTAPDGTVNETHAIVHANFWDDGLLTDSYVQYGSTPTVLLHTKIDWDPNSTTNPRISQIRSTDVPAGLTKATVLTYTTYNNVLAVSERDFTTDSSVSGTELRRTETTYVTSSSYTDRRLIHLPATVQVFQGGSTTPAARVDYAYDNYGTNHANFTSRGDIIMHDPAFDPFNSSFYNPATDFRGNKTSVTTYPDATSTANTIAHATTYDIAGNVMTAEVDCCQQKSLTYSGAGVGGNHDYAYPISVTSGGGGTTLTTSVSYDYNTGLVATTTDENNQVSTNFYNADSLRLNHTEYPNGGVTNLDYSDALTPDQNGKLHFYVTTSTKLDSPNGVPRWVDSLRYFDGRGDVARTFDNNTTADGWSAEDIEYDVMGRAYRSSNPYFSSGYTTGGINPEGFWTTRTFDQLGRVTQVTMPRGDNDNALTTSAGAAYDGVFTTVTDQAGKSRRQKVDALGRVVRLDEPDSSGTLGTTSSPNQATSYDYDVLGNLIHIAQPGPNSVTQNRYFKFDSLSRLIRERQVEHEANSSYDLSDPLTSNSSWSRKIDYNSSGLVTDGYDARGVHTQFSYDGLNRLKDIIYSDSTPAAHYYYDSQTLPNGAPNYTHDYTTGRLLAMTYGGVTATTGNYFSYDKMGRVVTQKQVTGANTYSLSYGYNQAGLLTDESYSSTRMVSYSYDEGARLSQVSDGTTTFASGFSYAAHGGLKSESWGNGAVHSIDYNKRLQATEIKLKQSASGSELQRYNYSYGQVTQSTGSVDTSKNNGQIGRIDGYINGVKQWDQRLVYDSLSRLSIAAEYEQGNNSSLTWSQQYTYDVYGNRFQSGSGNSVVGFTPVLSSDINAATNRFTATGSTPTTYDAAGNITTDTKFRGMNYSYDANGRQTFAELTNHNNQQTSVYDCAGQRVQTTASGVTRTMVYDIFGQQVADYNGTTLQRENIYRGGQLLSVVETPTAAAPSGLAATPSNGGASVALTWSAAAGATQYRVERKGAGGTFVLAATTTSTSLTDTGVSAGSAYLYRVCAANGQSNCTSNYSNLALGAAISFLTDPTITGIVDDPSGVSVTTLKAAHITELRTAVNAVRSLAGLSAASWTYPSLAIGDTIRSDDVRDLRTKLDEALVALALQTSSYTDPNLAGAPSGTTIKKAHIAEPRQRATSGSGTQGSGGGGGVMYVLSDVQGSSRAVMNNNGVGTSTVAARHDYLPFGEEIGSGLGLRAGAQGYGASDTNRKKYGLTERDDTGLDHTWWRKYENTSGRWTTPDPYGGSMTTANPQSFNRYAYVQNDPVNLVDPTGLVTVCYYSQWGYRSDVPGGPQIIYRLDFCIDYPDVSRRERREPREPRGGERRFQHPPKKLTPQEEQQKGFDDCAKDAIRKFRRSEYKAIAKIAVGTVATTAAAIVAPEALAANAAARSVPAGVRVISFSLRYKVGALLGYGSAVVSVFTGQLVLDGFSDSGKNNAVLDQKIAECGAKFPQANHSTWRTFVTTY